MRATVCVGLYIASGGECFVCDVVIKSLGIYSVHDLSAGTPVLVHNGIAWSVARFLVPVEEIHSLTFLMFPSIFIHR